MMTTKITTGTKNKRILFDDGQLTSTATQQANVLHCFSSVPFVFSVAN